MQRGDNNPQNDEPATGNPRDMKTAEAAFAFPVIGFTPNLDVWAFPNMNALTSCGPLTLKEDMARDMELVGADGRRWRVLSIRRLGRARPLLLTLVDALLSTPQSRIEHELHPMTPLSLAEVQDRVCAAIEAHPDYWAEEIPVLLARTRSAKAIGDLPDLLGLDTFEAY